MSFVLLSKQPNKHHKFRRFAVKKLTTVFSIVSFLSNLHPRSNVLRRFFIDFVRHSKQILIRYVI